jgi:hypothetical protein
MRFLGQKTWVSERLLRPVHERRGKMKTFAILANGIMLTAVMALTGVAQAGTFVYVSNAEDGDIGTYTLLPDGSLLPGARVGAGKPVMPMRVPIGVFSTPRCVRSPSRSSLTPSTGTPAR